MSKKSTELHSFKNKLKLWAALHNVKLEKRTFIDINGQTRFVYQEACVHCGGKTGGCPAKKNKKVLIIDTRTMRRYLMEAGKAENWARKNKFLWCVEWVKHV